jgi:hypothetical protein
MTSKIVNSVVFDATKVKPVIQELKEKLVKVTSSFFTACANTW